MEDFVIYHEHKSSIGNRHKKPGETPRANELASLHEINEWNVHLYFDGVIWYDGKKKYVQRVPCKTLSIGGYGESRLETESEVWIQSTKGEKHNIWYRLRTPAEEYRRYHEPFLWMARLAKHVVDFISIHESVLLDHFRADFYRWLEITYGSDNLMRLWLDQYGRKDFRQVLASQANFLWCQASQVNATLEKVPIWSEIHPVFLSAIPERKERETKANMFAPSEEASEMITRRKTTVTPYVYSCFKHLRLEKFLYCQEPFVGPAKEANEDTSHSTKGNTLATRVTAHSDLEPTQANAAIVVGDVVSLPQDRPSTWKSNDKEWYGYVQRVSETRNGRQLGILWLYRPSDTQCLKVPYPFSKELFLSDHCNCGDSPIYAEEVVRRPRVAFFGGPATMGVEFFVRQRYIEGDGAWQTLKGSDFECDCGAVSSGRDYLHGETLLVHIKGILQPVVLVENEADGIARKIKVRRLVRRKETYGDVNAEPNELVFTDRIEVVNKADVHRECHVRFYSEDEKKQGKIPSPYNRQGTGDFYYITSQDLQDDDLGPQPLAAPSFTYLKEGWDPSSDPRQPLLKGLDMFCGGGNFGHGLEEGGAVSFDHVVDWYNEAIHTYKANSKTKNDTGLFRGSVNDYLTQAMQGKGGPVVAQRGQVEMIAAGSPCPGFSVANPFKSNDRSLLNCSLAASVVAFVDFYRPKYALMENVMGMARGPDTENMLALIVSALVGMGYQVRTFGLDAWNFGSPQSRSRVFISIAAPGMTPLPEPPHTHAHPENVCSASLATLANGLRASSRYTISTPFKYITAAEATKDLPSTDARTSCIGFPAHRMSRTLSTLDRIRIGSVPRFPGGSTFINACDKGYMPQEQVDTYNWDNDKGRKIRSTRWQRVRRNALMPTVLTAPHPNGGSGGTILHWDDERLLTIMEVRRAQGFDDNDVLIGLPSEQWKIVGNSVARPVAVALGMSLRKAWLADNTMSPRDTNRLDVRSSLKLAAGSATLKASSAMVVIDAEPASGQVPAKTAIHHEREDVRVFPKPHVPPISSTTSRKLIETSTGKFDPSPHSLGLTGHHPNKTRLPKTVRLEPVVSSRLDKKTESMAAEIGNPHQYHSETAQTSSTSRGKSPRPSTHQIAKKPSAIRSHFITRETTTSKLTVETTTTVVREQVEPSPEL